MATSDQDQLLAAIRGGRTVVVAGTGVSVAASYDASTGRPHPNASWAGLLEDGLDWLREKTLIGGDAADAHLTLIRTWPHTHNFISAAETITRGMGGSASSHFADWLRRTIGTIEARDRSLLDALAEIRKLGNLLATTNYDGLLLDEDAGLSPVTWRETDELIGVVRQRDTKKIIFLHGYWRKADTVILDWKSYEQIARDERYREGLAAFWKTNVWVYVGCGVNGLGDPDFGLLLERYGQHARLVGHWDYCLVLDGQKQEFQAHFDAKGFNIRAIGVGSSHADLPKYLRSLLPPPAVDTTLAIQRSVQEPLVPGGLARFRTSLPRVGTSEVEINEKLVLYAELPADVVVGYSAPKLSVAGHAFDREDMWTVRSAIEATEKAVASFTVSSSPLAGLSMALMQLVRELSARPATKVWWIVDDSEASEQALSTMSDATADVWIAELMNATPRIELAVIVIDDFAKAPYKHKSKFLSFANQCKNMPSTTETPRVVFVLGSVGAVQTWSEDGTFQLRLTAADKQRCYQKMAIDLPRVLEPDENGLGAILRRHPEARWYDNDTPAFIDFLMEHGCPTEDAKAHWLAQIDGLSPDERVIVTRTAVVQLIGLHVEEKIALNLFGALSEGKFTVLEHFAGVRHLEVVKGSWRGLGLGSARRARGILIRAHLFEAKFIEDSLSQFLGAAIDRMRLHRSAAAPAAEFARHIVQRLSKEPLYRFPYKRPICQQLLLDHVVQLQQALTTQDPANKARWAGALSAVSWSEDEKAPGVASAKAQVNDLVCDLCEDALRHLDRDPASARPEMLVGLYRACANMARSSPIPTVRAQSVRASLKANVSEAVFWQVFGKEFMNSDAEHRCNELVHARLKFEDSFGRKEFQLVDQMTHLLTRAEAELRSKGLSLDAANWIMRSKYVWLPKYNERKLNEALARCADYLAQAKRCLKQNPEDQGTWSRQVDKAVKAFLKKNPSFQGNLS